MEAPSGNPAAMRAEAAAWRAQARVAADAAHEVGSRGERMEFEGPAAERLRAACRAATRRAFGIAERLQALASALDTHADAVEAELRVYRLWQEQRDDERAPGVAAGPADR